jgi:predicted ATPase/DNA-binding XRE family transcriptional regulator
MIETQTPFGALLLRLRSAAGLSQEDLAERSGLSRNGVSDLERGLRQSPRLETVRLLADALALGEADRAALLAAARPGLWQDTREPTVLPPHVSLPTPLTRLIGREHELETLRDRLKDDAVRWLTLTGPGGVGKTRLAIAVANAVGETYPDGVVFVDLTPLSDADLVPATIAGALAVRESAGHSLIETLAVFLASKRLLLVLDNCERILAAAPDLIALLAASPGLTLFATSRAPFHVRGEHEIPVLPLPLPGDAQPRMLDSFMQAPAVALFLERATACDPDFALTEEHASAVVAVCRRVDGLPLAIELAAARIKALPPATLLARLDRRLPVLTRGGPDLPPRQRTMRDAIAWSYDLLGPTEQALFRRLAVFAGGFILEAAETVVGQHGDLEIVDGIASLVEHSLLRHLPGGSGVARYRMFETIQEYAAEQLVASGEEAPTRERHAAWVLAFTEAAEPHLFRAEQQAWWERLERERPNVRAALAWFEQSGDAERALRLTGALGMFGELRGSLREGQDWLGRALAISDETAAASCARARALFWHGHLAWFRGEYETAQVLMEQSLAVALEGDIALDIALAQYGLALTAWTQGDLRRALALGEEATVRFREVGEPFYLANALVNFGTVAVLHGERERGEAWVAEGMALFADLGNRWHIAIFLNLHGIVAHRRGDLAQAAQHYEESARLFRELGDTWYVASPLAGLAAIEVARLRPEDAARLLGVVAALHEASGYTAWPWERERDEQTAAAARAALGEEPFARAVADGRRLPLAQAVAEAIEMAAVGMSAEVQVFAVK